MTRLLRVIVSAAGFSGYICRFASEQRSLGAVTKPAAELQSSVSDRIWTVPNVLSILRLFGVPLFLWLILQHHDLWALLTLVLAGLSDYLDGKIARAFNSQSKLGMKLDPVADRLYIIATLVGLFIRDILPWPVVALIVGRELMLVALGVVIKVKSLSLPPVHLIGKGATFNLLYAFPLLLLGDPSGLDQAWARIIGWSFTWWGVALYWVAGILYVQQVRLMLRQRNG